MTILFVCSGNTCRSPLAVAAWRHLQKSEADPLRNFEVLSAGLMAQRGAAVSSKAVAVAQSWHVNLEAQRARVLAPALLRRAHLICPMTAGQAKQIRALFPEVAAPIISLGFYAPRDLWKLEKLSAEERRFRELLELETDFAADIADPFGASMRAYRDCSAQILSCVRGLRRALRDGNALDFAAD